MSYDKIRVTMPGAVKDGLSEEVLEALAERESLDTLLWWYETELHSPHVEASIHQRLLAGQLPTLTYGKLVERIVSFGGGCDPLQAMGDLSESELPAGVLQAIRKDLQELSPSFLPLLVQAAGRRQKDIRMTLRAPVLVAGDCSASMQVCVMSASIIASIITGLAEAELVMFNHILVRPPVQPKDCESAVMVSRAVEATGQTANAAALVEAYTLKKKYNTIVMVTDEEENVSAMLPTGERVLFAELFRRYCVDVVPDCKLVLVSFLNDMDESPLMNQLKEASVPPEAIAQFKFNQQRPDLTKIDAMIGLLSSDTEEFVCEVRHVSSVMEEKGVSGWLLQEDAFAAQREKNAKRGKIRDLVAQLTALAPPEQLHQMLEQVLGSDWEVLSDVGSLSDWEVLSDQEM
eukprot:TRINITY_DN13785_c0_g1_i2.p2 TRINITY_DN13785_c0_g1~~TRINITY_DN13785_c0_g1_i2.p2  ORF type:complete len:404 (-),score=110.83 TRINITY_DN13785_c0_g1_i2:290-1501(-)